MTERPNYRSEPSVYPGKKVTVTLNEKNESSEREPELWDVAPTTTMGRLAYGCMTENWTYQTDPKKSEQDED